LVKKRDLTTSARELLANAMTGTLEDDYNMLDMLLDPFTTYRRLRTMMANLSFPEISG